MSDKKRTTPRDRARARLQLEKSVTPEVPGDPDELMDVMIKHLPEGALRLKVSKGTVGRIGRAEAQMRALKDQMNMVQQSLQQIIDTVQDEGGHKGKFVAVGVDDRDPENQQLLLVPVKQVQAFQQAVATATKQ